MLHQPKQLETQNGVVSTPVFYPVRNLGKKSSDNTPEYFDMIPDLNTAMVNSLAIDQNESLSFPNDTTIHDHLDFNGIVFADSGGFDLTNQEKPVSIREIVDVQVKMEADIIATIDLPVLPDMREKKKNKRIQKTIEFAEQTEEYHDGKALLFATVQGHNPRTLKNTIQYHNQNGDFDGYALGSLVPIRSNYKKTIDLILAARCATDKPIHVFGLGGILYQSLLLYLGVDSFDSSAYIRCAANKRYFMPGFGVQDIRGLTELDYLPCGCPVCTNYSIAEIKQSRKRLTQHNLWALMIELRRFKWIIEEDRDIEHYLDLRFSGNEVTKRAFQIAKQKIRHLS